MLWLFAPTEVTDAISVSMTSSDIERWDARDPVLGRICVGCLYRLTSRYHIRPCSYHMSPNGELLGGESPNPTRLEAKRSIFLYRIPFHLERDHIRHIDLATDRHFTVDYGVARLKMTNGDKNCGTQTYADTLWRRKQILQVTSVGLPSEYNLRIFLDSTKEGVWGLKSPWGLGAKPRYRGSGDEPSRRYYGNEERQKLTTFLGLKVYFYAKYVNNFIF